MACLLMGVYSRLMGKDEAGTRLRFNNQLDTVVRPAIDDHPGRFVTTTGDAFLVEYPCGSKQNSDDADPRPI